ncbi:MAG: hypothetical protein IJ012_05040, partial [Clostridia bacterium]|nr:hypothetical protein [Clostridia bacterium]
MANKKNSKKTGLFTLLCVLLVLLLIVAVCLYLKSREETETPAPPVCTHIFSAWESTIPATCETPGKETHVCTLCGETEERPITALGHDEQPHEEKAPTCTEIGWDAYVTCSRCDYTTYASKDALGHSHDADWSYDAANHYHLCTREGCEDKADCYPHTYDGELDADCNVCGAIRVTHCSQPTTETVAGYAATCTENGKTDGEKCTVCGETITEQENIPALCHDEEQHAAQAPTCTEIGWDAYVTCKREGCTYTTYEEKAALGHTPAADWAQGETTHYHPCTRANCTYKADEASHNYDNELDEDCNTCGKRRTVACSHSASEPIAGYPATCTVPGKTDGTKCSACGETLTPQEDIPALGHDEQQHTGKEPTCTEGGWYPYVTCKRDGCIYTTYAARGALGHDEQQHVGKEPTCTEGGWNPYVTCKRDGCIYTT